MQRNDKNFVRLPDSELQIMQLIWDMEKEGVKEIYAGAIISTYPEVIGHLALTTILTLITRLQKKGFIEIEKRGRTNYSKPLISEEDYKRGAVENFAKTVFKGDGKALFEALCASGIITERDAALSVK